MTVDEIFKEIKDKMDKRAEVVKNELAVIRSGRASKSIVEGVKVDYYGAPMLLKQLASITVPEPRLIMIQPWDKGSFEPIQKAITSSDLGLNPTTDGKVIRITVPQLTEERRQELKKIVRKIAEEGKVSIRTIRRDAMHHIEKTEKDGLITEDEKFKNDKKVQDLTDGHIKRIDELLLHKEKEIDEV